MIWVQMVWMCFWGWDFKEVWVLIIFLFYVVFFYFWLLKGWYGEKLVWLVVGGFVIIMFNLVVVNLIIVGLYLYV